MAHIYITSNELHKLTNIPDLPLVTFIGQLKEQGKILWTPAKGHVDRMVTVTAKFINETFKPSLNIVQYP